VGCVYLITCNVTRKRYVGKTMMTIEDRLMHHRSGARCGSKLPIHKAIRRYGIGAFEIEILYTSEDEADLLAKESYYIHTFRTVKPRGYNKQQGLKER
jgi:group I intron endonuclease